MIQGSSLQCFRDVMYLASLHNRSMSRPLCPQSGLGCIGTAVSYPEAVLVLKSSVVASVSLLASERSPVSEHLLFDLSWPSIFGRPSIWFGDILQFYNVLRLKSGAEGVSGYRYPSIVAFPKTHKSYFSFCRSFHRTMYCGCRIVVEKQRCSCHSPQAANATSCGQLP